MELWFRRTRRRWELTPYGVQVNKVTWSFLLQFGVLSPVFHDRLCLPSEESGLPCRQGLHPVHGCKIYRQL